MCQSFLGTWVPSSQRPAHGCCSSIWEGKQVEQVKQARGAFEAHLAVQAWEAPCSLGLATHMNDASQKGAGGDDHTLACDGLACMP